MLFQLAKAKSPSTWSRPEGPNRSSAARSNVSSITGASQYNFRLSSTGSSSRTSAAIVDALSSGGRRVLVNQPLNAASKLDERSIGNFLLDRNEPRPHDIKRTERRNVDCHPWIAQIFSTKFFIEIPFKLLLAQSCGLDRSCERDDTNPAGSISYSPESRSSPKTMTWIFSPGCRVGDVVAAELDQGLLLGWTNRAKARSRLATGHN